MKPRPEKIKPSTALVMMRPYCGGKAQAMQEIAQHMKGGNIRTFARYWSTNEADIVAARRSSPPAMAKKGKINHRYFTKAVDFDQQVSSWNWDRSMFWCTTGYGSSRETRIYKSVRFSKTDIEKLVGDARKAEREKKKRGGPEGNVEQWHRVWMAILEVVHQSGFSSNTNPHVKNLRHAIHEKLGGPFPKPSEFDGLSVNDREDLLTRRCPFADGTIDPILSRVKKQMRSLETSKSAES